MKLHIVVSGLLCLFGLIANGQDNQLSSIMISDFDGNGIAIQQSYCNPGSNHLTFNMVNGGQAINGQSAQLYWSIPNGEFCGWIASFKYGPQSPGLNITGYTRLRFKLKRMNGNDTFHLQMRDMNETQIRLTYNMARGTQVQTCVVNIGQFRNILDFQHIENVNFAFVPNAGTSPRGSIIIDDLEFLP